MSGWNERAMGGCMGFGLCINWARRSLCPDYLGMCVGLASWVEGTDGLLDTTDPYCIA